MIRFSHYLIVINILFSCGDQENLSFEKKEQKNSISYAKHFTIQYDKKGVSIDLLNPEGKGIERTVRPITPKGKSIRIIAMSSTHIGMLEKLGLAGNIVGVSDIQYVWSKIVLANHKLGKVASAPQIEEIIKIKPDVIFYDGFGKEFPHQKQLEQLGIQCVQNYDWRELHPLGKAEWIVFFGTLLHKEKEAFNYFVELVSEYNTLKATVTNKKNENTLLSGNMIGDLWYCPAGKSYNAQLFADANCNYSYSESDGTGSLAISIEELIQKNANCSMWLNPGFESLEKLKTANPKAFYFRAFKDKNVYCYSKKGNYFWEMSAIEPQKVLSDIIQITHPELKTTKKLYFYSKLN
jgi:iron complex transport system substrate-binding protein